MSQALLFRQWIWHYPDGTLDSAQLTYWHGRHRHRGGNGPHFKGGVWCKWVGTHWEEIA